MATVTDSSTDVSEVTEMPSESYIEPKVQVPASVRKLDVGSSSEVKVNHQQVMKGFDLLTLEF